MSLTRPISDSGISRNSVRFSVTSAQHNPFMSKRWSPGFFSQLFFKGSWGVEITPSGLIINGRLHRWEAFAKCHVESVFFWGHLLIQSDIGQISLRGMSRSLANEIASSTAALRTLLPAIEMLRTAMDSDRYVPNKAVREALAIAGDAAHWWRLAQAPKISVDLESLRLDLELINQVAIGNYSQIEARNSRFISNEIAAHDSFFNSVETSVLTSEQRVATIVMEDRNLVIAAAGSGKTSVLVAKAGYLVKKGYASPSEILVLSFNGSVAGEIESRIEKRLVQTKMIESSPTVSTFHAFGLAAINETGPALRLAALAQSSDLRSREIQKIFFDLIQSDPEFQADAIKFLVLHAISGVAEEAEELAAQFGKEWRDLIQQPIGSVQLADPGSFLYKTLSGDIVRSKQELQITNWLTLMGIEFVYEKPFPPVAGHPWTQDYRPDFYYPKLNLWHEHFGINIFGEAPSHWGVNRQGMSYEQQAASKREVLAASGVSWFETSSGDFETGNWEKKLKKSLEDAGAEPKLISWDRFIELASSSGFKQADALDLLGVAISHFKSNHLTIDQLRVKAQKSTDSARSVGFVRLFERVFSRYQDTLAQRSEIDFDDMLRIAAQRLHALPPQGRYKAILIDEFQDMSNARAELVKALLHQNQDAVLFAVGDDWQSIYRFTGSDITVMTEFQKLFGYTRQVALATTFRCNQGLANLSSEFIRKNPRQIDKSVVAISKQENAVVRVVFHAGNADPALSRQLEAIAAWARRRGTPADVGLLGRYNFLEPANFTALAQMFKDDLNLSFSSVHRSKGLGFDFVIVLGMSCKVGSDFPSTRQDDPVLSLFMPVADALPFAEERRLFYVAMTRARRACILLTPKFGASPFVTEILESKFPESVQALEISKEEESEVPDPLTSAMQQVCPTCQRGRLLPRVSVHGPFMVCERKVGGFSNCPNIQGHTPPGQSPVTYKRCLAQDGVISHPFM
jgi:DNA helicase-4